MLVIFSLTRNDRGKTSITQLTLVPLNFALRCTPSKNHERFFSRSCPVQEKQDYHQVLRYTTVKVVNQKRNLNETCSVVAKECDFFLCPRQDLKRLLELIKPKLDRQILYHKGKFIER